MVKEVYMEELFARSLSLLAANFNSLRELSSLLKSSQNACKWNMLTQVPRDLKVKI